MNPHQEKPADAAERPKPLEGCARWLIRRAARTSPLDLADRLEEEWLADLVAQQGRFSRLRFAIGCCWVTRVIAHDYLGCRAAAATPVTAPGSFLVGQHDLAFFSRRTTVLLLIVGLHIMVIWGFATGFAQKVMNALPGPMITNILNAPPVHNVAPPIIRAHLRADVLMPKFDLRFELPPDSLR